MWRHLPVGVGDGMGWWVQPDGGRLGIRLGRTMMVSTVCEAQNRHLCRAFPFVFYGLLNIFKQESVYFLQYLQFKFLVGVHSLKFWQDNKFSNKIFHVYAIPAAQIRSK